LKKFDPEKATNWVGIEAGMPSLVAWKVVEENDMLFHSRFTPEERYKGMLRWVETELQKAAQGL